MGLCGAPGHFMPMMMEIIAPFVDRFVQVYMDDILIYSAKDHLHTTHVQTVLKVLKENGLFAKLGKCELGVRYVEFLGTRLSADELLSIRSKV